MHCNQLDQDLMPTLCFLCPSPQSTGLLRSLSYSLHLQQLSEHMLTHAVVWLQEFMILPVGVSSFKEAMRAGSEVYHNLKSIIKKKYGQDAVNVGDEGGFAPNVKSAEEALELINAAIDVSSVLKAHPQDFRNLHHFSAFAAAVLSCKHHCTSVLRIAADLRLCLLECNSVQTLLYMVPCMCEHFSHQCCQCNVQPLQPPVNCGLVMSMACMPATC